MRKGGDYRGPGEDVRKEVRLAGVVRNEGVKGAKGGRGEEKGRRKVLNVRYADRT